MALPKGYTKKVLLVAVEQLNAAANLDLKVASKSGQIIVDTVVESLADIGLDVVAEFETEMLDTFAAFGIVEVKKASEQCAQAIESKTDSTVWAKDTLVLPKASKSKKDKKDMGKKDDKKDDKKAGIAQKAESADGLGIIASIPDFIQKAKKKGITYDALQDALVAKFPDRDAEALGKTLRVQIGTKNPPLRIEKDRKVRIDFSGEVIEERKFIWVGEASEEQIAEWKASAKAAKVAREAAKAAKDAPPEETVEPGEEVETAGDDAPEMSKADKKAAKKDAKKAAKKAAKKNE